MLLDAELARRDVVGFLLLDVLPYGGLARPDGGNAAALRPEAAVAELVLEVRVQGAHHRRALALEVPHEARRRRLGRHARQHMRVVRHEVPLYYLDPLTAAKLAEYLPQGIAISVAGDLSPILRCGHDAVFAHPLRVRQAVCLVCHDGRLSG